MNFLFRFGKLSVGVLTLTSVVLLTAFRAFASDPRRAELGWTPITGASRYEFQVSRSSNMTPILEERKLSSPRIALKIRPGTYYYRVRGLDQTGTPGPWSAVDGFIVNPRAPEPRNPPSGAVVKDEVPDDGLRFQWAEAVKGTQYLFEVHDQKGRIFERSVNGTEVEWKPIQSGKFRWRVGFQTPGGAEWSEFRTIEVSDSAVRGLVGVSSGSAVAPGWGWSAPTTGLSPLSMTTGIPAVAGAGRIVPAEAASTDQWWNDFQIWLLLRGAQAIAAYTQDILHNGTDLSGNPQERRINVTGSALVNMGSAELRWRAPRAPSNSWLLSGSLNGEIIRQTVLGTDYWLPRFYTRVFYTTGKSPWRVGPFLHFQYGTSSIFYVVDRNVAPVYRLNRMGVGGGGVAVYQASDSVGLSALVLIRYDLGTAVTEITTGSIAGTLAWEAGFGVALGLSARWMLEGRIRALMEPASWPSGSTTSPKDNSFQTTYILVDLGVGFRF